MEFPVLYDCSLAREGAVESMLVQQNESGRWAWDVRFPWDFNDQEVELVASFLNFLDSNIPIKEGPEKTCCRFKRDGEFNIFSLCTGLKGACAWVFPWNSFPCVKATLRVFFFVCTAAWGNSHV